MKEVELVNIKEAEITNNCPECFNQDMTLRFFQKHLYGTFYHKITSEITHELRCNTCESIIYPVKWTEDIERIFEYYQKMIIPSSSKTQFTWKFYLVLALVILLTALVVYLIGRT